METLSACHGEVRVQRKNYTHHYYLTIKEGKNGLLLQAQRQEISILFPAPEQVPSQVKLVHFSVPQLPQLYNWDDTTTLQKIVETLSHNRKIFQKINKTLERKKKGLLTCSIPLVVHVHSTSGVCTPSALLEIFPSAVPSTLCCLMLLCDGTKGRTAPNPPQFLLPRQTPV